MTGEASVAMKEEFRVRYPQALRAHSLVLPAGLFLFPTTEAANIGNQIVDLVLAELCAPCGHRRSSLARMNPFK